MPSALDRIDFGPPPSTGRLRALTLAVCVHALLIAALTWGVSWKRSDTEPSFSAELWSSTVQQAAPPLPAPPPLPSPPDPAPAPPPAAALPARPPPQAAPPKLLPVPNVDIALEQEKKRKLKQQREQEDEQDKRQAAMDAKAEKAAQAKRDKQNEAKQNETKQREAKLSDAKRQADEAKKKDVAALEAKNKAAANAAANASANAAAEQQRKQNLARALGMAGSQGDESSKGSALASSGPTSAYKNRLAALFKRNIVFSNVDSIQGNPKAEVQLKVSSTGLIMSARLSKSSGVAAWDEAVLRAVEKTERIPLDENGKVVTDFPVGFGPKD